MICWNIVNFQNKVFATYVQVPLLTLPKYILGSSRCHRIHVARLEQLYNVINS